MGMEGIELVLRVEETYGIEITDAEASQVRTVGDLFRVVRRKLGARTSEQCLTAKAFYRLRCALIQTTGCVREAVCPASLLNEVLPRHTRRRLWPDLARHLGLKVPKLRRPPRLVLVASLMVLGLLAAGWASHRLRGWPEEGGEVVAAVTIAIAGAVILTRPFAFVVPGCQSVGDFAKVVLRDNFGALDERCASDAEIWGSLRSIVAEEINVDIEDIEPETDFAEDLNVN